MALINVPNQIKRLLKTSVTGIAAFVYSVSALAQYGSDPACSMRISEQSISFVSTLNDAAGKQVVPPARLVRSLPPEEDKTFSRLTDDQRLRAFVSLVFDEVKLQAIQQMTEYLYVVTNERSQGVTNARIEQIPGFVAQAFSYRQTTIKEREDIKKIATATVAELQKNNVRRLNLDQVTDEVQIHVDALNDIRRAILAKRADYTDYKQHLNYILSTPTGRILTAPPFSRHVNLMRTKEELKNPINVTVDFANVHQAQKLFYDQFRAYWATSESLWQDTAKKFQPLELYSRDDGDSAYFWLARFIESTPQAVVAVLKKLPNFKSEFCYMLGQLDRKMYQHAWKNSFMGIWNEISVPLWVLGVAVLPVLAVGAPLWIMFAGVTILQVVGIYEVHKDYKHMLGTSRYRAFHETMMVSGLGSQSSVDRMVKYDQSIQQDLSGIGVAFAVEVASFGFAKALATNTAKALVKMSRSEIGARLYQTSMKSYGYSGGTKSMSLELTEAISRKMPLDDYADLVLSQGRKIDRANLHLNWVQHVVNKLSKTELDEILFKNREYGFGKTLFLTEVGTAFATQGYSLVTQDYFSEFQQWDK